MSDETPGDVATLYSWANLQGAKYRDFSSTRARAREMARQRILDAMEAERKRTEEAVAAPSQSVPDQSVSVQQVSAAPVAPVMTVAMEPPAPVDSPVAVEQPLEALAPAFSAGQFQASPVQANPVQASAVQASPVPRPLTVGAQAASAKTVPAATHPTPSQWFALQGIFPDTNSSAGPASGAGQSRPVLIPQSGRVPALAVFSLAGGVGKSCVVATLGRALSAHGERVLMVDTAVFGTLQYFFGSHEQRIGALRTFKGPDSTGVAPIDLLAVDSEAMVADSNPVESMTQEILRNARPANRILIDLETAFGAVVRRIMRMSPTVLVPVTPDVRSVASVGAIEAFFQRNPSGIGQPIAPMYVLNQFDENRRLHHDVREMLQGKLGERLLPVTLHRSTSVSEALAEGLTVMDYAPDSQIAMEYEALAAWVRAQAAPADHVYRGVRWSER